MKFYNPVNIINYPGARKSLVSDCKDLSVLVFCSESAFTRYQADEVFHNFFISPLVEFEFNFGSNPSLDDLSNIAAKYSGRSFDVIVGLGGGSSMDAAKISAVSIPAHRSGYTLKDLLSKQSLVESIEPISTYQVPTTAGTGSEVTPFATVWDYSDNIKKSLSCKNMYATSAYVDSVLIHDLPIPTALATGLDALNQAMESIWNKNFTPLTRSIAIEAACSSLIALPKIDELTWNSKVSGELASASLMAGIAISQTRTAVCHSISYPLTLAFGLPHGLACAFSMIAVYKFNLSAIEMEVSVMTARLGGINPLIIIEEIFEKYDFYTTIQLYISSRQRVIDLMPKMHTVGRADNNIINMTPADLSEILEKSCAAAGLS